MENYSKIKMQSIKPNSSKLLKLKFLLENSKIMNTSPLILDSDKSLNEKTKDLSQNLSLYLSIIEKPINLLFSIDQFIFEFSKKTYQKKKSGEFFQKLKERKKLSLFYGHLTKKQLIHLFNKAKKNKGYFSKNIFSLLERRLDVIIYRSGLTKTIGEAKQLIKHKKILVNSTVICIPSYLVNPGDIVSMNPERVKTLINYLDNSIKQKQIKTHPKIFGDFYSKLKKNLSPEKGSFKPLSDDTKKLNLEKPHKLISLKNREKFQSKFLCKFLIQFLCTRIKLRSFYILKQNLDLFDNYEITQGSKIKKDVLILFKWKAGLNLASKKDIFSNKLSSHKVFFSSRGCFQNKPSIWNTQFNHLNYKHFNIFNNILNFSNAKWSNSKSDQFRMNGHKKDNQRDLNSKKKNLTVYRTSFLSFLRYLDNYRKFASFISLHFKQSLFKKFLYKQRSLNKITTFRVTKPIHLEVSYNLFTIIYLYSPQRINFPFYIDLDLIKRSL